MKKRRLRKFVLPTIYVMAVGVLFMSISLLSNVLESNQEYDNLTVSVIKDSVIPVIKNEESENSVSVITKPFIGENVTINKTYYDMQDDEKKQENSLVYYKNTYLQNTGIIYTSSDIFDVISVYDGTVTNIGEDEILGKFIEVTHNTNLKTIYYSLSEITVKKDDVIISGDVIGKSGSNKLDNTSNYSLLFEVYHNGIAIDPEEFYNMDINDLK